MFVLGGTLTSPLIFLQGDIIAEIFEYQIMKRIIACGFIVQTIFSLGVLWIVNMPHPEFANDSNAYSKVFSQMWYLNFSSCFAFLLGALINAKLLTRWKEITRGNYFLIRSFFSSTLAEAIYSGVAILMMQFNRIPIKKILTLILISYSIKAIYSLVFAIPMSVLVKYLKVIFNIGWYKGEQKNSAI